MTLIELARKLRPVIEHLAESLPDADATDVPQLFPVWQTDTDYSVGDRRQFNGILWKCLTAHHSQDSWTPDVSPSLWVRIDDPGEEWPEWVQPMGSTDAYAMGAKVSHNERHWISKLDANVWEPGVYGWDEVTG